VEGASLDHLTRPISFTKAWLSRIIPHKPDGGNGSRFWNVCFKHTPDNGQCLTEYLLYCVKLYPPHLCSAVGIAQSVFQQALGWTAQVQFSAVQDFSLLHSVQTNSGAHPASYPMGTRGSFPQRGTRQGRVADHSPPCSAEVKKGGAIPPFPPHLHGIVLNSLRTGTTLPSYLIFVRFEVKNNWNWSEVCKCS
jgi:hypothetical protein